MSQVLLINPTAMEAGLAARAEDLDPERAAAFAAFARTGLPHRRLEGWKWTDLRGALRAPLPPADSSEAVIAPSIFAGVGAFEIVVMNGGAEWSGTPPEGISLSRAPTDAAPGEDHPLAYLAAALGGERVILTVADGARIERPVLIRRIAGDGVSQSRLSLSLGASASLTVIESFDGVGGYFSNSLVETDIAADAALSRFVMQDESDDGVETSLWLVRAGARARYSQTGLLFGAKAARVETRIDLRGADARVEFTSAAALAGARHADLTSFVAHNAPGCESRQIHKSALSDGARGVFQGKFLVAREGQRTDARMTARALLLSGDAEANHKPELEIYADDVQCGHGSTAGALDPEALFYMRQRGLDEAQTRALLVEAFLGEVFADIAHPGLHAVYQDQLSRFLGRRT